MIKKTLAFLFFSVFSLSSFAQPAIGNWRDHFSYTNVKTAVKAGSHVYCGTELAMFSYDTEYGNTEKLSKLTGFSDYNIAKLAYNETTQTLIIAYDNSNIDIVKNNTIYNFADIKRKQINGDKKIYNIKFQGTKALMACGFGVVVFDTEKLEFSDTWVIGNNASEVIVYDVAVNEEYIYAGTEAGLLRANVNTQNLADYRNWKQVTTIPNPSNQFNSLLFVGDELYVNSRNGSSQSGKVYRNINDQWEVFNTGLSYISGITQDNGRLIFTSRSRIKIYDGVNLASTVSEYVLGDSIHDTKPKAAFLQGETLYIADSYVGLVEYNINTNQVELITPQGPRRNYTGRATFAGDKMYLTAGTLSNNKWIDAEYFTFHDDNWSSVELGRPEINDFYSILVDPKDENHLFIGAWGKGIFEFKENKLVNEYNELNSTLQIQKGYIMPSSMIFDSEDNLWVSNFRVGEPVSVKTPEGEWESFNFNGSVSNMATGDMIITDSDNIWLQLERGDGILVNDNDTPLDKTDDFHNHFYPTGASGESFSKNLLSIAQDKDGEIWVGLDEGVIVYHNPENVFDADYFYADKVQLTAYGKDTTEQYLLGTESVTAISVDGANRKWLGTQNSGVFLVSENGKEELLSFSTANSPLPSNTILDVAINHISGEIFFITDKGTVSYRGEATKGNEKFGEVYVFPNPVRPDYTGKIAVTGLADDVNVKFTDISGNLVFETEALGGQAIWNGKTFDGNRVHTGIYLVFCSNEDGSETFVTKLLFMN